MEPGGAVEDVSAGDVDIEEVSSVSVGVLVLEVSSVLKSEVVVSASPGVVGVSEVSSVGNVKILVLNDEVSVPGEGEAALVRGPASHSDQLGVLTGSMGWKQNWGPV